MFFGFSLLVKSAHLKKLFTTNKNSPAIPSPSYTFLKETENPSHSRQEGEKKRRYAHVLVLQSKSVTAGDPLLAPRWATACVTSARAAKFLAVLC